MSFPRDKNLAYFDVNCHELDCMVTVGVEYEPGRPGVHTLPNGDPGYPDDPPQLQVCEVWVGDTDIGAVLLERVAQQIESAAWERMAELQQEARDNDAQDRAEARHRDMMEYGA